MKALIPAAGFGTRFLPETKCIPKEMLPIGAKPALQLIVEEALAAGANEVVIITSSTKPAIKAHFTPSAELTTLAAKRPEAAAAIAQLDEISSHVKFMMQTEQRGLGHAVLQAAPYFAGECDPILILLGDALVSGPNASADMVAISRRNGSAGVVGVERVSHEKVSRYGIIAGTEVEKDRCWALTDLVEKPAVKEAPSDLAIAGRYLLPPQIFDLLTTQQPGHGGEIQLTDAIKRLLIEAHVPLFAYRYHGHRHDIGNPNGYLEALNAMLS